MQSKYEVNLQLTAAFEQYRIGLAIFKNILNALQFHSTIWEIWIIFCAFQIYSVHKYCTRQYTTKKVYINCKKKKQSNLVSSSKSDFFFDPVKCYTIIHQVPKGFFYFLYIKISVMAMDTVLFWNIFHLRQVLRYILIFLWIKINKLHNIPFYTTVGFFLVFILYFVPFPVPLGKSKYIVLWLKILAAARI